MSDLSLLPGLASIDETQQFLTERFSAWDYQAVWQKTLALNRVSGSLLGLEFATKDFPDLQKNLPQMLAMGCNHFQWVIEQPEELAFVRQSPFFDYFRDSSARLVSRNGVIFSLRLPSLAPPDLNKVIALASSKVGIEQWDRIVITPQTSEVMQSLVYPQRNEESEVENTLGLNFLGEPDSQQLLEIIEKTAGMVHLQVPFNLVQFRNFLRRSWQFEGNTYALPKLLEKWQSSVSFRSPFFAEDNEDSGSLLVDVVKEFKNYSQDRQTLLSLLDVSEKRLNQNLRKWQKISGEKVELEEFQFMPFLKEACDSIQNIEGWEHYLSTLWFPPFHHHVRAWTLKIPEVCQAQWRWMVNDFMENIHDLMGLQSEAIRTKQAQRMQPFSQVLNQYFPEMPIAITFGAKTLLLLASTPWPETVFFPWKTLDSTIEYLGLMRFPLLNNSGRILKELSKIKIP